MKVRARVKAPEYLPEAYCCCDGMRETVSKQSELAGCFEVDLSNFQHTGRVCRFCGRKRDERKEVFIASGEFKGTPVALEALDLDEGPMEAQ